MIRNWVRDESDTPGKFGYDDCSLAPPAKQAGADQEASRRASTHRDWGCQYTSDHYQQMLRTMNITCSMSRTGCCYDDAVMERFFWSLKHEWTKFESLADLEEARLSVFRYIETFYNSRRIYQTLGYRSPDEFEAEHEANLAA